MSEFVLYEKLDWYTSDEVGMEMMRDIFAALIKWAGEHDLLLPDIKEYFKTDIPDDFSLTSEDLTPKGKKVFSKAYEKWTTSGEPFKDPIKFDTLERALQEDNIPHVS